LRDSNAKHKEFHVRTDVEKERCKTWIHFFSTLEGTSDIGNDNMRLGRNGASGIRLSTGGQKAAHWTKRITQ
jgi:hypothetical protein